MSCTNCNAASGTRQDAAVLASDSLGAPTPRLGLFATTVPVFASRDEFLGPRKPLSMSGHSKILVALPGMSSQMFASNSMCRTACDDPCSGAAVYSTSFPITQKVEIVDASPTADAAANEAAAAATRTIPAKQLAAQQKQSLTDQVLAQRSGMGVPICPDTNCNCIESSQPNVACYVTTERVSGGKHGAYQGVTYCAGNRQGNCVRGEAFLC